MKRHQQKVELDGKLVSSSSTPMFIFSKLKHTHNSAFENINEVRVTLCLIFLNMEQKYALKMLKESYLLSLYLKHLY